MANLEYVKKKIKETKTKGEWKTRDAAVKALRKLGAVTKDVVKAVLEEKPDGTGWRLKPELLEPGAEPAEVTREALMEEGGAAPKAKAAKPKKAAVEPIVKKPSITSVMTRLLREGKTNKEVLERARAELKEHGIEIPESHNHYPAWYRSKLRAAGEKV